MTGAGLASGQPIPIAGTPVLDAAGMRAAEATSGIDAATLMRRAGEGVAETVRRLAAGAEVLVVCGPGNNGGDGWIAAATLARGGHPVRVVAPLGEPRGDLARAAREEWSGPVGSVPRNSAPIVVDALFGIGLTVDHAGGVPDGFPRLIGDAGLSIAVDLPSGVDADTGAALPWAPGVDLTLALGFAKPAHLLQPGAARCGTVRCLPLGLEAPRGGVARVLAPPDLAPPGPGANKFTRGMVAVVPGPMAGAALLASEAAMRAGAGYVLLLDGGAGAPHALVRRQWSPDALDDERIGAVLIGNGLGRDDEARARVAATLESGRPMVIDGDALHLIDPDVLARHDAPMILTPHEGEFRALFGDLPGCKIDRARAAARRSGATVIYKGADTVVAAPDEDEVILTGGASDWLSTAGSGDVLAGAAAAMLAGGRPPRDAAAAAVWLHGEAARRCGAAFLADDLARALSAARGAA